MSKHKQLRASKTAKGDKTRMRYKNEGKELKNKILKAARHKKRMARIAVRREKKNVQG